MDEAQPPDRDAPPAGLRDLLVIQALLDAGVPLTPTAINERLNLPKATIHRICQRLLDGEWFARDLDGKRLLPGRNLVAFTGRLAVFSRFTHARVAILRRLSEAIGETCNITIPIREGMVYLDRVETRWPLRIQLPVGGTVPFYCTASGKLYLSSLPRSKQRRIAHSLRLDSLTKNTITDPEVLLDTLKEIAKDRVGVDDEEFVQGMVAVAVPVDDERGRLMATVAVHGPIDRMSFEEVRRHVPALREAAGELRAIFLEDRL